MANGNGVAGTGQAIGAPGSAWKPHASLDPGCLTRLKGGKTDRLILRGFGGGRHDVHAAAVLVELDRAIDECEERPIAAGAHIDAGKKPRPALAHQDAAGGDALAAVSFHAETFADAVAAVANAALTFLVCHKSKIKSD